MRAILGLCALLLIAAAAPPSRPLSVTLPDGEDFLPPRYGASADAVNGNCLSCHSAAMITAQPRLTRVQWGETIAKMRNVYAAPIDPADDAAILDWLVAD